MPLVGLEVILEAGFSVTGLSAEEIMATKCSVPDGYHSITPYFTVRDAARLIEFLVAAFNATIIVEQERTADEVSKAD